MDRLEETKKKGSTKKESKEKKKGKREKKKGKNKGTKEKKTKQEKEAEAEKQKKAEEAKQRKLLVRDAKKKAGGLFFFWKRWVTPFVSYFIAYISIDRF